MDLNQLIAGCKNKEQKAQQSLYLLYKDKLFALCLKYSRNHSEAEDTLQDSFISILQKIEGYTGKGSFEGWMKRITINKAIDKYKKTPFLEAIQDRHVAEEVSIEGDTANVPLKELLTIIQELPDRYRMVFNMYELDNYTHQEIAQKLDISTGTSKSNLHRAKCILKQRITTLLGEKKMTISNGY